MREQISEYYEALGIDDSAPFHYDHCEHGDECYLCTFPVWDKDTREIVTLIDVYIHDDGRNICARYGDEPHEYCGYDVSTVFHSSGMIELKQALWNQPVEYRITIRERG